MVLQPALAFEQLFNDKSGLLDFYSIALLILNPRQLSLAVIIYSKKSINLPRNEEGAVEQA